METFNCQRSGKLIWVAALWQGIPTQVENLVVKAGQVDAMYPRVMPLKNTETTTRWSRLLELKGLRWFGTGNIIYFID